MAKRAEKESKETSRGRWQTQSVRFNETELSVVKEAAALKGWSVSKLIQDAAIEKAAGILNLEHGSAGPLGLVAHLMVGAPPRFWFKDVEIDMPRLLDEVRLMGWEQAGWMADQDSDGEVWYKEESGCPGLSLAYNTTNNQVSLYNPYGGPDKVRIEPDHLAPRRAQEVFEAINHCGASELARLLKRIYEQVLYASNREQRDRKMIDPTDLIDSS